MSGVRAAIATLLLSLGKNTDAKELIEVANERRIATHIEPSGEQPREPPREQPRQQPRTRSFRDCVSTCPR